VRLTATERTLLARDLHPVDESACVRAAERRHPPAKCYNFHVISYSAAQGVDHNVDGISRREPHGAVLVGVQRIGAVEDVAESKLIGKTGCKGRSQMGGGTKVCALIDVVFLLTFSCSHHCNISDCYCHS
jgi:hypothetical protein